MITAQELVNFLIDLKCKPLTLSLLEKFYRGDYDYDKLKKLYMETEYLDMFKPYDHIDLNKIMLDSKDLI